MFSSSSNLTASELAGPRHNNGLLKHTPFRTSKQEIHAKKMFGSKMGKHGKDFLIGKKFKKKGKDVGKKTPISAHSIGPSPSEFDKMMSGMSNRSLTKKFSRKQFG